MMRPGRLKHRVTIEVNTPTEDEYGERQNSWAELETVYAQAEPLLGDETLVAGKPLAERGVVFTMRYRSDLGDGEVEIHPKYRLSYDSRTFEIISAVDVDERHRWLEVIGAEVV